MLTNTAIEMRSRKHYILTYCVTLVSDDLKYSNHHVQFPSPTLLPYGHIVPGCVCRA